MQNIEVAKFKCKINDIIHGSNFNKKFNFNVAFGTKSQGLRL